MGSVSKRKVKAFIRFFAEQQGMKVKRQTRTINEFPKIEQEVLSMKERVWHSAMTSTPFDKNLEGMKNSLDTLEGTLHSSQKTYLESIMALHKKVAEVKDQQDEEHQLRIKQNKLLVTKGQIILLEKKIGDLTKVHRPSDLEPLKEKLRSLKTKYKNIINSHPDLADVTQEILTTPNLEREEIAAPMEDSIPAPLSPKHLLLDDLHQDVDKASSENLDMIEIPVFDDTFTMPSIISQVPKQQESTAILPAPFPPPKKGMFAKLFSRKIAS